MQLPDITSTQQQNNDHPLHWVGMEQIAVPLTINQDQKPQTVTAKANVYVSLDDVKAKGIHMSRLHAIINQLAYSEFGQQTIDSLLAQMVESQSGLSNSSKLELGFELLLAKDSLLSEKTGFQSYPVHISAQQKATERQYKLTLTIPYSSTCPCSASLSRQLYAQAIEQQFNQQQIDKQQLLNWVEQTSVATPHSQRSYAKIDIDLADGQWPSLPDLIMQIEQAIATPVQTMVKRVDEQEFARLNATNLMFVEDAARKLKSFMQQATWALDYKIKVDHRESLHAHNAVAFAEKF